MQWMCRDDCTISIVVSITVTITMNMYIIVFGCPSVLTFVNKRKAKFLTDYLKSCNSLCRLFGHAAKMN